MSHPHATELLSISEVTKLFNVSLQTILNWEKAGRIRRENNKFRPSDMRKVKALQRKAVLSMGVSKTTLEHCKDYGVEPQSGRWSLEDVERLLATSKLSTNLPSDSVDSASPAPETSPQPLADTRSQAHGGAVDLPETLWSRRCRFDVLSWYRSEVMSPCDLPDWFWVTPEEPPFEPPSGCTSTEVVDETIDEQGHPITTLRTTGHWIRNDFYPEEEFFMQCSAREALNFYGASNEYYESAKEEWRLEYWRRQGRSKCG